MMTGDTKAIIGTILTTGIGIAALGIGLLGNRIGSVEAELRELREGTRSEFGRVRGEVRSEIQGVRSHLGSRIDRLRDEMRENYHRLDGRMRAIEQGFARIDQRLDTLERAVIPAAEPSD